MMHSALVPEPADDIRGDVARVYLYFQAAYWMELSDEEQNQFEAWNQADPPDEWERTWNERMFDVQGNPNPFASVGQVGRVTGTAFSLLWTECYSIGMTTERSERSGILVQGFSL